jgi:predicted small metal-binding protein
LFFDKEIMLTVSCREVGMDCDYVCKGETEEEIMKNAEEHAIETMIQSRRLDDS